MAEVPNVPIRFQPNRISTGLTHRRLGELFRLMQHDIEQLELARHRVVRPIEMFIRVLNVQQPNLKVKDFELKCAAMARNDVVEYIRENVYEPFPIDIN